MDFNVRNGRIYPRGVINTGDGNRNSVKKQCNKENGFRKILQNEITGDKGLQFSKHAATRVLERNIQITNEDLNKLNNALRRAQNKGCRDSVLIYKNKGFITSVQNKKVITVCDLDDGDGMVTNVDSVVFV